MTGDVMAESASGLFFVSGWLQLKLGSCQEAAVEVTLVEDRERRRPGVRAPETLLPMKAKSNL